MPSVDLPFDRSRLLRVRDGATVVVTAPAIFRIEGPGALQCMQGLLTNDLQKPGDGSLVYGALLTPKGMIVADGWVLRHSGALTMLVPAQAHAAALDILQRSFPPRLARVSDRTGTHHAAWLVGAHAFEALVRAGLGPLPDACGRVGSVSLDGEPLLVALAPDGAPFTAVTTGAAGAVARFGAAVQSAGASMGQPADLEASRILRGWPAVGAEIDERTLPQEVRYDAIGGVSYTKGCYTGQETVARLHFRGHTNRELRGLYWRGAALLADDRIVQGEREVGTLRSVLRLDDRMLGLAPIRREVQAGDTVVAGGRPATVVALPFGTGEVDE